MTYLFSTRIALKRAKDKKWTIAFYGGVLKIFIFVHGLESQPPYRLCKE